MQTEQRKEIVREMRYRCKEYKKRNGGREGEHTVDMHRRSRKILGMRRLDMQRAQRKETVYEKKYRHAESTNKGDGEKRTAR
jgi:hypothetical protein